MPAGESMDVELMPDGSWHPLVPVVKKDKDDRSPPAKVLTSHLFVCVHLQSLL